MVTKDDVLELHSQIVALQERQSKSVKYAKQLLQEIEDMGDMLAALKKEYECLRDKAKNL